MVVTTLLAMPLARAQVRVVNAYASAFGDPTQALVAVSVRDSASRRALPGATVNLVMAKDTMSAITDEAGSAHFPLRIFEIRPAILQTSFLGYKTRRDSIQIEPRSTTSVEQGMQEDPLQLNSIIVKADAVAVVVHGDTTVFNAAAFSSMQGDMLRNLLSKFPGISISRDGIKYQGQKIDRVLVNGNNLFGKDIGSAMDMVLSKEVQSVKVYQTTAQDDPDDDGTQAKERVLDVLTWKPMEKVGQLSLNAFAAAFTDGEGNWSAGGRAQMGSYTLGTKPRIRVDLAGAHNAQDGLFISQSPVDEYSARVMVGKDVVRKIGFQHQLFFQFRKEVEESGANTLFFPSESWQARADTSRNWTQNKALHLNYQGNGYVHKKKWSVRWNASLGVDALRNLQDYGSVSVMDGTRSAFRKNQRDSSVAASTRLEATFIRKFNKPKRNLTFTTGLSGQYSEGGGGRVDTLAGNMSREWLGTSLKKWSVTPYLGINWNEPLTDKISLQFHTHWSYQHGLNRYLCTNLFDGTLDPNNTQDYTHRQIKGSFHTLFIYGRRNDGLYALVAAGVKDIHQGRQEAQAYPPGARQHYLRPDFIGSITYTRSVHQASFSYDEQESVPSVEQLRASLDDRNPLFLRAGNPNLTLPVARKSTLSYSLAFPSVSGTLLLEADGTLHTHSLASRTLCFTQPTWLEAYSYLAPAGSCLVIPENVEGKWNAGAKVSYSQYFTSIKTRLTTSVGASASETPYYMADVFHRNQDRSLDLHLRADLLLPTTELSLDATASPGRFTCDGQTRYDYWNLTTSLTYNQQIGNHLQLRTTATYHMMNTTQPGAGYKNLHVDAQLSWRFGKDKLCSLNLFGNDLTNSARPRFISATDTGLVQSYSSWLGRNVGISFTYTFMRR